jgi:hypothetical protein
MKASNVGPRNVFDGHPTNFGKNDLLERSPIFSRRHWLQSYRDVLLIKPLG